MANGRPASGRERSRDQTRDQSRDKNRDPNVVGQRDLSHENRVLRELVTVYRHLSGLALQDADLAGVTQLLAAR